MPYKTRRQLPKPVKQALRGMPQAQELWRETFNDAYNEYASEIRAYASAWSAVRRYYAKDERNVWRRRRIATAL